MNRSRKNEVENGKAFYRLMNNAVNGKRMENLRSRIDVKLVNNEKLYANVISKPTYMTQNM